MDEKRIDLTGFLRLIDFGLRREGDETFAVSEAGIRACPMTDEDWRLLTDEEQIVITEMAADARLDFPCSLADVRRWVELNWPEIPENLALALEEAAPGNAPGGEGQATAPEKRTAQRRAILTRILEDLREVDPTLNPDAMPGRMVDFLTLCQAVDRHLFTIQLDAFDKARKGLCRFTQGARATDYYREKLPAIRAKLG